nr:MAG TPA_asm: hypothetical protein [Bacteriophage sp.]
MEHKEIRREITQVRLQIIKALRDLNAIEVKNCIKRLKELDHILYDDNLD